MSFYTLQAQFEKINKCIMLIPCWVRNYVFWFKQLAARPAELYAA